MHPMVSGKRRSVLKAPASAKISKGDELATFRLGSTVVLAFEKGFDSVYKMTELQGSRSVKMGQQLLELM